MNWDQPFHLPENFDLRVDLSHTLGVHHTDAPPQRVRIRFEKNAARYVQEHRWHPTQQITVNNDGSATLELELSDLTELKSWVLSFGSRAIVEVPRELRDDIQQEVAMISRQYQEASEVTA